MSHAIKSKLHDGARLLDLPIRSKMLSSGRSCRYPAGATLVASEEAPRFVGLVVTGLLRLVRHHAEGKSQTVGLMIAGDTFGHRLSGYRSSSARTFAIEAATDVSVSQFDQRRFDSMVRCSPELERFLVERMAEELSAVREWLSLVTATGALQRVALLLMILAQPIIENERRAPRKVILCIPLSRADLGHYLGLTPETISRSLRTLHDLGAIRILDPGRFEFLDAGRLEEHVGAVEVPDGPAFRRLARSFANDLDLTEGSDTLAVDQLPENTP